MHASMCEHTQRECAPEPLFNTSLLVPWYVHSGDYTCPDEADALLPAMGEYHECIARRASRHRDCVVRSCDSDRWEECSGGSSCTTPSMDEMNRWTCVLNRCAFESDPNDCLAD